jgi:hypothetical protein
MGAHEQRRTTVAGVSRVARLPQPGVRTRGEGGAAGMEGINAVAALKQGSNHIKKATLTHRISDGMHTGWAHSSARRFIFQTWVHEGDVLVPLHHQRRVQKVSKYRDPETVMRYDHGREDLDQNAVNFLGYDEE